MSFDKFSICVQNREKMSSFEHDIETIKGYLCEIGNTYLLIAYRVYEMDLYKSYEGKYKNLVEACEKCLGWKKSTTYNMLNIVKRFGTPGSNGIIPYDSLFGSSRFSYSQLCEMLSLSDKQLEKITPDTTVKEIREMKKQAFQTSGKQEVIDVVDFVIGEEGIEEASEPAKGEQPVSSDDSVVYKKSRDFWLNEYKKLKEENQQLRTDRIKALSNAEILERELKKLKNNKIEHIAFEKDCDEYYSLYLEEHQAKALFNFLCKKVAVGCSDYNVIASIILTLRDVLSQEGAL